MDRRNIRLYDRLEFHRNSEYVEYFETYANHRKQTTIDGVIEHMCINHAARKITPGGLGGAGNFSSYSCFCETTDKFIITIVYYDILNETLPATFKLTVTW